MFLFQTFFLTTTMDNICRQPQMHVSVSKYRVFCGEVEISAEMRVSCINVVQFVLYK